MLPANKTDLYSVEKEFQEYAYIVSHDLNAPLRHIKQFSRLLIENRKEAMTEEEASYVTFLENALHKIEAMQFALLTFSRVNTRSERMKSVNLNDILAAALNDLNDMLATYKPEITCDTLPTLVVDPKQFRTLITYLIDNAVKFHEETSQKRKVTISAQSQENGWIFSVKDNGIGIDKEYHEDVFRIFRRLNPDKFSGLGASLAIARKIVQRHGGIIYVESAPEQGTCISFFIPLQPQ